MPARQTSRLATTQQVTRPVAVDHSEKTATRSTSVRHMAVTKASPALYLLAAGCPTLLSLRDLSGMTTLTRKAWLSSGNVRSRLEERLLLHLTARMARPLRLRQPRSHS